MDWFFALDGNILLWIQENVRTESMHGFWRFITSLGDDGLFWIACGILMLFFKKTRKAGLAGLLSMALNFLMTNVTIKNLVARPRPYTVLTDLEILIEQPGEFSFPSGHTSSSFAFAFAVYLLLPPKYGVPALVLAALISLSRLYVGVHYPTDVLGGLIVGCVCALIIARGIPWLKQKIGKKNAHS